MVVVLPSTWQLVFKRAREFGLSYAMTTLLGGCPGHRFFNLLARVPIFMKGTPEKEIGANFVYPLASRKV